MKTSYIWLLPMYDLVHWLKSLHELSDHRGRELVEVIVRLQWDVLQANGVEWTYGISRRYLGVGDLLDEYIYAEQLSSVEVDALRSIAQTLPEASDYLDQWFVARDQILNVSWYRDDLVLEFH